ncbi:MAG: hypothetical protein MJZ77_04675 [Bacteroidales bacterium]|nr:hypothetical protein [Bacteroidales bacterium]
MKRYYIALIALTAVLILASFCTLWFGGDAFQTILPFLPLYFGIITGLQHYAINKSFYKDPRTFVKNFLGLTVGSLFLHLVVLFIWAFTHAATAKIFILAFGICYVAYLVFETIALILLVKSKQK